MSKIEALIQKLCPDGVDSVRLGEVCEILDAKRKPVSKGKRTKGNYPYYGANGIQDYIDGYIFDGTFLLIGEDGSVITKDNSPIINWATGKIWVNNHAHILAEKKEVALLRYLYYALQTCDVSSIVRGTPPKLNQENLRNITIPRPPLPVQEEVVRILDKFSALEAELEAELEARKKQYEHYRDHLLNFNDNPNVKWVKLGEVAFYAKERVDAAELAKNSYIGVENLLKDKLGRTDSTVIPQGSVIQFKPKDILIGNIRPYLRKIWKADCWGGTNGDVLCIRSKNELELTPDYLFHVLASERFFVYDMQNSKGAKMPRGDKSAVMNFEIPLPLLLSEQNRIAGILDRFEALTTSLQEGLPAEISARHKQYEYYRDRLLSFGIKNEELKTKK